MQGIVEMNLGTVDVHRLADTNRSKPKERLASATSGSQQQTYMKLAVVACTCSTSTDMPVMAEYFRKNEFMMVGVVSTVTRPPSSIL